METIYADWSLRRGVMTIRDDSDDYTIYPSLLIMAKSLEEPHRIILEATLESFNLEARRDFLDQCSKLGHKVLTVSTRETTRWRYRMGFGEKPSSQTYKTDLEDVKAIRAEAQISHLKVPGIPDQSWIDRRKQANDELMRLRSQGEMRKRPRSEGYTFVPYKDIWSSNLIKQLPPFGSLTEIQKIALRDTDNKNYNKTIVAAAAVASKYARDTREFDRLAGLYVHAYPSQIRADLMFWGWAGGGKRQKLNPATRKRDDLSLSDYRRELRWLYHQLKDIAGNE